jgi:hypothetical protein
LNNEILSLKNEIQNKNQIIMQKDSIIANLKNQLISVNNNPNNNQNIIKLQNMIIQKEQEITSLNKELLNKEKEIFNLKNKSYNNSSYIGGKSFAISFESIDSRLKYPIICKNNTTIARLEEEVYNEFPDYKECNTYLTCNGETLKRFKTIEENKIKQGNVIIVNKIDE